MSAPPSGPDEFDLIARLFAPLAVGYEGALGLKDDAAILAVPPGRDTLVTVDAMVAGVHFLPDDPPDLVARKLVRVNLSDLAAKAARPTAVMLAASFPQSVSNAWLDRFGQGLAADLGFFQVPLIGGDTVSTPGPLTLSLTAFGSVAAGQAVLRSGACAGDDVWVSGTIGDGALGLAVAQGRLRLADAAQEAALFDRYRLPQPRLELGQGLAGLASAGMDVSDGLVQDLGHLCRASGVGADIAADTVPLSDAARQALADDPAWLASVLEGGDDYELLFTAAPGRRDDVLALAARCGTRVARIGGLRTGQGVTVRDGAGRPLAVGRGGWRHFGGEGR